MYNFTDEVIMKASELQKKITEERKIIAFAHLIRKKQFTLYCDSLADIQIIINKCLQIGDYRRACKYIIIGNKIIKQIKQYENQIVIKLTDAVVEN